MQLATIAVDGGSAAAVRPAGGSMPGIAAAAVDGRLEGGPRRHGGAR